MALPQHPDATLLSEEELSSVASDTSEFINRRGQSARLLDAYEAVSDDDKTKIVLQAALDYLPVLGSMRIMEEIILFNGDGDKYRQLANFFVDAVLKPMRLCGAPGNMCPSPSPQAAREIEGLMALIENSSRSGQSALKRACLWRDSSCCVLTGHVDAHEVREERVDQAGRRATPTQCAHIIPFGLRKLEYESALEVEKRASIWWALYRYFPSLEGLICAESVNQPGNAMTLDVGVHQGFGALEVGLEPSHQRSNVYRVRQFGNVFHYGLPREVSLSSAERGVPIPHGEFLRAHFAVASILEISGIGARMNKYYLNQGFWDGAHGPTEADGSTPLEELVARRLLIGTEAFRNAKAPLPGA